MLERRSKLDNIYTRNNIQHTNHSHCTQTCGYRSVFSLGMDIVDAIAAVTTGNKGGHQDVPLEAVTITEVRVDD